jgi:hypothetical protein
MSLLGSQGIDCSILPGTKLPHTKFVFAPVADVELLYYDPYTVRPCTECLVGRLR